jgi:selenocysteine lyase/cysteine desulfurase
VIDLQAVRAEIPALSSATYLNTGGYAPSPRRVYEAAFEAHRFEMEHGPDTRGIRSSVEARAEQTRGKLAELFGVTEAEIAFTRAVSEGIDIVAWGLDWQPGDEVVVSDQEHPTGRLPWLNLRERRGIDVKVVPLDRNGDGVLEALDAAITPRTRLLSLSHVTAESGLRLPAAEICQLAHKRDVRVLLDAAQAVGQFPIDLRALDVDFYATTGHKWLLGGAGIGALYVKGELLDEVKVSWTGAGAVEGASGRSDVPRWHAGAKRFEFGSRLWPAYVGYGVAVDWIREVGLEAIEARVSPLASSLKKELAGIDGVTVLSPDAPERSTGIVTFAIDGMPGDQVATALWERARTVCRAARAFGQVGTRISVAFFTSEDELSRLVDEVRKLARERVSLPV